MEWLKEKGLFRGEAGNAMRLGLCSRSSDVIEPVLKPQWWVSCKGMADDACAAVRDGRITILPPEFKATWFRCAWTHSCQSRKAAQQFSHLRVICHSTQLPEGYGPG